MPVAARATLGADGGMRLHGRVVSLRGERAVEGIETGEAREGPDADAVGVRLAERLLEEGAAAILAEVRAATAPSVPEP